jgi:hypothetical protein
MKTLNGYPVDIIEKDGFTVQLSFENEFISPYDFFDINEEYGKECIENILNDKYKWVIARVTVFKHGIELASNSLGCCDYEYDDLIKGFKNSGYYEDIVDETIEETKRIIKLLKE